MTTSTAFLDDDPTGAQESSGVGLLFFRGDDQLQPMSDDQTVHVITNTRAMSADQARRTTSNAASWAVNQMPRHRLALRGDSTLRAHFLAEYEGLVEVAGQPDVLLLVPAMPHAGRTTFHGTHWVGKGDDRVPAHRTEYAADQHLGYATSNLLEWAEERSEGRFLSRYGASIPLDELRRKGSEAVRDVLGFLGERPVAICAPDAIEVADLQIIAEGLHEAESDGVNVLVWCGPTFASIVAGTLATSLVPAHDVIRGRTLVLCGSYVGRTTRQIDHLTRSVGLTPVVAEVETLVTGAGPDPALVDLLRQNLDVDGIGLLMTPREPPPADFSFGDLTRVATGLASIPAALHDHIDNLVTKGGITSAVGIPAVFKTATATVVGPVLPGVSLLEIDAQGTERHAAIVPGNVGEASLLTDLVGKLHA